jgi:hypothetical protein
MLLHIIINVAPHLHTHVSHYCLRLVPIKWIQPGGPMQP